MIARKPYETLRKVRTMNNHSNDGFSQFGNRRRNAVLDPGDFIATTRVWLQNIVCT